MRTVHAAVIALSCTTACEKDPRSEPSPEPIVVKAPPTPRKAEVKPEPPLVPPPAIAARLEPAVVEPRARTVRPAPADQGEQPRDKTGVPIPPSTEPKAYAAWLKSLPQADQRKVSAFCKKHRVDFEDSCGGIGPLHIPYPPYMRARVGGRESLFASVETWDASLSTAQRGYIQRECPGGEDQPSSDLCGDNTPLVVALDDQAIQFTRGTSFAFQAGAPTTTDWPTAATPWIAFDANGDGTIDRGAELFGSDTVLPAGGTATNGFLALAALDANHDGVIDGSDPQFARLVLWADRDADGKSSAAELAPLATTIVSISLAYKLDARCDARGNCEGERSAVTWRDARGLHTGSVVDVYLPRR